MVKFISDSKIKYLINSSHLSLSDSVELRSKPRILEKRVSFPTDESLLVRNLEPTVPETCPGIS